jgi:HK97 family phage major capsid protein
VDLVARETFEDWIPIENGDKAIQALNRGSVTERLARPEPMGSDTKWVPRSGTFAVSAVAKGAAYAETAGTNDYVELIARKAGGILRVAEEDLGGDSPVDIINTKKTDASRNLGYFFDNATLGTSAAANGTTVLYTSVLKAVRTTDSNVSYTADANYVSGSATYDNLSNTLSKVEDNIWFDDSQIFVAASPAFKAALRGVKDTAGNPIFQETPVAGKTVATLFGYEINWTVAARVSAVNTQAPTGNPLLIIGNRDLLIKGMAKLSPQIANSNPGFAIQRAATGVGFTTDEALLKAAMRRGFAVGAANAFAVFEKTS